jgi:hypothetical protein
MCFMHVRQHERRTTVSQMVRADYFVVTAVIIAEYVIDEPLRRRTDGLGQRYGEIVSGW